MLNFRDELDAWKLRCADVIFSERRESRPQQIMPGEELRGRITSTKGPFIIQQGAKSLAEPCAECNESDASVCPQLPVLSRVLFHEKASQMAPREQV